ncbi:MAG: universal stress protein [Muribaculaceae bacterium]|nr:universal stress protein [Muribaculaceae bacterium]
MISSGYITLAIHTNEHALALKSILEEHGIIVKFDNILNTGLKNKSVVRVKIRETDLDLALKIVESGDGNALLLERKLTGVSEKLLIPVDFSEMSRLSIIVGFDLARRLKLSPVILNAFSAPSFIDKFPFSDSSTISSEVDEAMEAKDFRLDAEVAMRKLKGDIKNAQSIGRLPDLPFSTIVDEGVAEEVILATARRLRPRLIVMATRGRHKRQRDMIGSVTAEVLDSCRIPIVTIPENFVFSGIEEVCRIALFCNMDQNDLLVVDSLMRMFSYPVVKFFVIPVIEGKTEKIEKLTETFCKNLNDNYKTASFIPAVYNSKSLRFDFETLINRESLQMIVVPNKKKNILSRLFSPGIAHRMLFEKDMPIFAFPV